MCKYCIIYITFGNARFEVIQLEYNLFMYLGNKKKKKKKLFRFYSLTIYQKWDKPNVVK